MKATIKRLPRIHPSEHLDAVKVSVMYFRCRMAFNKTCVSNSRYREFRELIKDA